MERALLKPDVTMTLKEGENDGLDPAEKAKKEADAEFEATLDGLSDEDKEIKRAEREALLIEQEYDGLSEAEKQRRIKAAEAFKQREDARKQREAAGGGGAGAPVTEERLVQILNDRDAPNKEQRAFEIARKHTSSDAEARAAVTFYENRVQKTDNMEDDILFAIGGMNRKRQAAKTREVARALDAKDRVSHDNAGTQRDGDGGKQAPKLPDGSPLASYTFVGNGIYSKKLKNGKTMFVNTKAIPGQHRTWVE